MNLKDTKVVVTGGSRGLGLGLVEALTAHGARVTVVARDRDALAAVRARLGVDVISADITEEQVRLKNHCDYFRSILQEQEEGKGKKLSFILQEIGREINTTGSKAYDATIQQNVVLMKDELEKAKEQVLNVL